MRTGGTQGQPAPPAGPAPGTPTKPPSRIHRAVLPDVLLWAPSRFPETIPQRLDLPTRESPEPGLAWRVALKGGGQRVDLSWKGQSGATSGE